MKPKNPNLTVAGQEGRFVYQLNRFRASHDGGEWNRYVRTYRPITTSSRYLRLKRACRGTAWIATGSLSVRAADENQYHKPPKYPIV